MDIFQQLQHAVAGYIASLPLCESCAVFIARPRVLPDGTTVTSPGIQGAIQTALAGVAPGDALDGNIVPDPKAGAAVIVLMPRLDCFDEEHRDMIDDLRITVRVVENIIINTGTDGTQVGCEDYAHEIRRKLHQWRPGSDWCLQPRRGGTIIPVRSADDNEVIYDIEFFTRLVIEKNAAVERVRVVAAAEGAKVVTTEDGTIIVTEDDDEITTEGTGGPGLGINLFCATAGAAIYYTTDGTFPFARNANATLYTGVFNITESCTLLICAFKDGLAPSDVTQRNIVF